MSNQDIFDMLAAIECELFHKWADMCPQDPAREEIKAAHQAARKALETFAKATGCRN